MDYFDCVAWAKAGEIIAQYTQKGSSLFVTGRLQTRSWEDKNGSKRKSIDVVVTDFNFIGGGGQSGGNNSTLSNSSPSSKPSAPAPANNDDIDADKPVDLSEIPF